MAQQTINIGAAPDDGTGDTLRVGGDKINDNFTELYTDYMPKAGGTFTGDIVVPDEAYDATAWNGSLEAPTKNAVRDKIESLGSGITELDDIPDVNAPTPANGDVLTWDSTPGEWVPQAPAGGVNALDDLSDVDAPTPSDGDVLTFDSGSGDWVPAAPSSGSGTSYEAGPVTAPTTADLATWDNQGTSTVTDGNGAMILKPQVDGILHGRYKTAPATPYDIYCRVDQTWLSTAAVTSGISSSAGIMFKDTGGDNERLTIGIYAQRVAGDENQLYGLTIQRWTGASPPVFSATPVIKYTPAPWPWIRVNNDGTTLTLYVSKDAKNWLSVGTETIATFIDGAASYGVYAYADANATEAPAIFHYFSTTAPS